MSKVNQSAGDTASVSSATTLRAVPASSTKARSAAARRSGVLSCILGEIALLAGASIDVLQLAGVNGDKGGSLAIAAQSMARQIGAMADAAQLLNGEGTHRGSDGWMPTFMQGEQQ